MVRGAAWRAAVVLAVLWAGAALAGETFGSQTLLRGLWTPAQLAGSPEDRKVGEVKAPDLRPPERTAPSATRPPLPDALRGVIRRVNPTGGEKVVALTFDLCERATNVAGYEGRIVDFLRAEGVKATFFAGGKWMRSHPERAMQLMADPLFELGNHAWTHGNLALMDRQEILDQVLFAQAQYELLREELARRAGAAGLTAQMDAVPTAPAVFRLPYGRSSPLALEVLAGLGLPAVQWDVEGERDEAVRTPEQIADWDMARVRPGSVILLHANAVPQKTPDVVRLLASRLRAAGYRFVTVSELFALGPAEAVDDGYFTVPGDNRNLDTLFEGKGVLHRRKK